MSGVELRPEQLEANNAQLEIAREPLPEWRKGDARALEEIAGDIERGHAFQLPALLEP